LKITDFSRLLSKNREKLAPLLISVQGFAFRGRPMSLLVPSAPAGSHLFRFSRKSLRFALQINS